MYTENHKSSMRPAISYQLFACVLYAGHSSDRRSTPAPGSSLRSPLRAGVPRNTHPPLRRSRGSGNRGQHSGGGSLGGRGGSQRLQCTGGGGGGYDRGGEGPLRGAGAYGHRTYARAVRNLHIMRVLLFQISLGSIL